MKPSRPLTIKTATAKLMRFCVYRERCHKEVREKLWQLKMGPNEQDEIIAKLIADDFLNEERFATVFVRDKFHLHSWGKRRLVLELKHRNISEYLIKKAIAQIDETDYQKTFENLFKKRLKSLDEPNPLKRKRKLADYLLRKGYESNMVYDRLREMGL